MTRKKSIKRGNLRAFVGHAWTFTATAVALVLGAKTWQDQAAVNRLDAREKLDAFMADARRDYLSHCLRESEALRPLFQARYDALVDVAAVDSTAPPYDRPCVYIPPPSDPTSPPFVQMPPSRSAPHYPDWDTFVVSDAKTATLWIGEAPLTVDVNALDWLSVEASHRELLERMIECTNAERSKVENTFMQLECRWSLDENNKAQLVRFELR